MPLPRSSGAPDLRPAVTSSGGTLTAASLDDIDLRSRDPIVAARGLLDEQQSRATRAAIDARRAGPSGGLTAAALQGRIGALRHVDPDDILLENIARHRMASQGVSLSVGPMGPTPALTFAQRMGLSSAPPSQRALAGAQARSNDAALRGYMAENRLLPWRPEDYNQVVSFFDSIMTTAELADVVAEVGKWEAAFDEVMSGAREGYKQFSDTIDAQLGADRKARETKIQLAFMVVNVALSAFGFGPVGSLITGAIGLALDPEGLERFAGVAKGTQDLITGTEAYRIAAAQNVAKGTFDALTKYGMDQLTARIKTAADIDKKRTKYNKELFDMGEFQSEMTKTLQSFKAAIYGEHKAIVRRYREPQQLTALLWELCRTMSSPYKPLMDGELVSAARQARDFLRRRSSEQLAEAFACPVDVRPGTVRSIADTVEKSLWAMWADQSIEAKDEHTAKGTVGDQIVNRLVKLQVMERRDFRAGFWNKGAVTASRAAQDAAFADAGARLATDSRAVDGLRVQTGKVSSGTHAARGLLHWAQLYLQSQPFQRVIPLNREVARRILAYQEQSRPPASRR